MKFKADVQIDLSPLIKFSKDTEREMEAGLKEAIEEMYDVSQSLVPEATGALKRSGAVDTSNPLEVSLTYGESNEFDDERATAVEFGTMFQKAQPYITPALARVDVTKIISDHIFNK
jgi:HK97 gp10 family phage protein